MKKPTSILVFDNLNIAVCDENGQQIPELQKSAVTLLAEHAERCGYDLDGVVLETPTHHWRIFRTEDGRWNRELA